MKTFKLLAVIVVALIFIAGLTSTAMSAEPIQKPQTTLSRPNPCPPGWHVKQMLGGGGFSCVPDKPKPLICPGRNRYYDSGCEVGCSIPIT